MRYGYRSHAMKRLGVVAAIGIAGVLATGSAALAAPGPTGAEIQGANLPGAIAGQYIVVFKDASASAAAVSADAHALAGKVGGTVRQSFGASVPGFSARLSEVAAKRVAANPAVSYVEQDRRVSIAGTQSRAPWGLDRIDQRSLPLSGTYTSGTAGTVTTYVIDTGVRLTHTDLGGRARSGYDFVDDDGDASDCQGHGTHVAGTVAGATYGVAKSAKIVSVRVLDCDGYGSYSQIIAGVDWVTRNAAKPAIANMSLGGSASAALDAAVNKSIASGVTYVVAAGNDGADACGKSPGRAAKAITVGATSSTDTQASFSNFGSCLDLFAPGVDIVSTSNASNTATASMSGTSMAAPHVAGAAARYLSANPAATPAQIRDALVNAATGGKVTGARTGSPNRLLYTGGLTAAGPSPTPRAVVTACRPVTNGSDRAVPDRATVESTSAVRGCAGKASATTRVTVRVSHTDRGDLALWLIAPDGTTYRLKTPTAGDNVANLTGSYTVNASTESRNGTWRLRITDAQSGDRGTLDTWTLTL